MRATLMPGLRRKRHKHQHDETLHKKCEGKLLTANSAMMPLRCTFTFTRHATRKAPRSGRASVLFWFWSEIERRQTGEPFFVDHLELPFLFLAPRSVCWCKQQSVL